MSEYERPERLAREPTGDDVRQLMGASTPHFALQIRNRIRNMIDGLAEDHPARVAGEREIARLEKIAFGGESRGAAQERERPLPSVKPPDGPSYPPSVDVAGFRSPAEKSRLQRSRHVAATRARDSAAMTTSHKPLSGPTPHPHPARAAVGAPPFPSTPLPGRWRSHGRFDLPTIAGRTPAAVARRLA